MVCIFFGLVCISQVENLTSGVFYEFKVRAVNLAGVGLSSEPSKAFACEAWTMAEPGQYPVYSTILLSVNIQQYIYCILIL